MALTGAFQNIENSIHNFEIQALNSEELIQFSKFKGKKILIVNVASKCGFTRQYKGLEQLYQSYKDELVVIGVPCNQFLGQEPGSEEDIATFCSLNYGVTFPLAAKVNVKGKHAHAVFQWLTKKELNGQSDFKISWNFNKFLLDEEGKILEHFGSRVKPNSQEITKYFQ